MNNRFFQYEPGSGAMLDIGVYALSIVRSFMDEKPDEIGSGGSLLLPVLMSRQPFFLKILPVRWRLSHFPCTPKQPKRAMISCEKGYIEIMEYPRADKARIVMQRQEKKLKFLVVTLPMHCFMRWRIWNMQFLHVIPPAYI